jgi:hypothetical protein
LARPFSASKNVRNNPDVIFLFKAAYVEKVALANTASNYHDHTTPRPNGRPSRFLHGEVENGRHDIAARNTICRLQKITHSNGADVAHVDMSPLKATGFSAYEQTIWPRSVGTFDLLSINVMNPSEIYLHSQWDTFPRQPAISTPGDYNLVYEVLAEYFPALSFTVKLQATGNMATMVASLV